MTDNLPLLALLGLALFVGGFLTGFGMYGWMTKPYPHGVDIDPADEAGA